MGRGLVPSKYPHHRVAIIATQKRAEKIAQFAPFVSRRGMLLGSCSMGVEAVEDVEMEVDIGVLLDIAVLLAVAAHVALAGAIT